MADLKRLLVILGTHPFVADEINRLAQWNSTEPVHVEFLMSKDGRKVGFVGLNPDQNGLTELGLTASPPDTPTRVRLSASRSYGDDSI